MMDFSGITIAKALKLKNKLAGDIAKLTERISRENVQLNDNVSHFDVRELYEAYQVLEAQLLQLKAAIAIANAPIWFTVFKIVELKGQIAFLRQLDTKEGTFRERDYTQTVENTYKPQLDAAFVAEEIAGLENLITSLQDDVDDFNHRTKLS